MQDELNAYLDALEHESDYQIDTVLKESEFETTERVFLESQDDPETFFIRKRFDLDCGLGAAYERLYLKQLQGCEFSHLPKIFEYYKNDRSLVVVMECVRGRTLYEYVQDSEAGIPLAHSVFPQICDAVIEMHETFQPPLIHRDLKPSNIMIADDGVYVIDFGIARSFNQRAQHDTRHFGTPAFAPPEQFGFGQTDERTDIYALGMLLYFCLSGEIPDVPFSRDATALDALSDDLRRIVLKATAFDPAQRYNSARELKDDYIRFLPPAGLPFSYADPIPDTLQPPAETLQWGAPSPEPVRFGDRQILSRCVEATGKGSFHLLPQRIGGFLSRIPRWFGVIWNILLVGLWVIFLIVATIYVFSPDAEAVVYPLFARIAVSYGMFVVGFGVLVFALLDTRGLRKHARIFRLLVDRGPLSYVVTIAIAMGIALLCASSSGLAMSIVKSMGG